MKRIIKEIIAFILALVLILTVCSFLAYKLLPPRYDYGACWNMYLEEPRDSIDVLFIGSSLAYCNIVPAHIYKESGLTSYVISGGELTASLTYYYLKQALETQTPDVVMIEATSVFFNKYQSYTKQNISYMPYGLNRFKATLNAAESEERLGLLFPLYNYHSLWEEYDFKELFKPRPDSRTDINAGYTYIPTVKPQEEIKQRKFYTSEEDLAYNLGYIEAAIELCRDRGIAVELFLAPNCCRMGEEDKAVIEEYFSDVTFTDYNQYADEMAIDMATDFCGILHLNYSGACKFSTRLSADLGRYEITDKSRDTELWQSRVDALSGY